MWAGWILAAQGFGTAPLSAAAFGAGLATSILAVTLSRGGWFGGVASRSWLVSGAAVVAVVAAVTWILWDRHPFDRTAYVHANRQIAASLPILPGAAQAGEIDRPYYLGDDPGADGMTTMLEYRVPPRMAASMVAGFYRGHLRHQWRLVEVIPGRGTAGPVLNFARGPAGVSVNLMSLPQHHRVELSIDQRRYR